MMSARTHRLLDAAYRMVTDWTPHHAREVLDHHAWSLEDALATLEAQRLRTQRYLTHTDAALGAGRVGTGRQRETALADARWRADRELDRRQALLAAVHRAHIHGSADA